MHELADPRHAFAHDGLAGRQRMGAILRQRNLQRVVRSRSRIEMIPPQPSLDVRDAKQLAEFFDIRAGGEVVAAHAHRLRGDFRRSFEHGRSLAPDGLAEHHDRAQHEHDQRIDRQQAAVARLAPQQRRHGEVDKQTVPFDPRGHRLSLPFRARNAASGKARGGATSEPAGKCSIAIGASWKGGVQVGERAVARVAGLGEERKIGEAELRGERPRRLAPFAAGPRRQRGVQHLRGRQGTRACPPPPPPRLSREPSILLLSLSVIRTCPGRAHPESPVLFPRNAGCAAPCGRP